MSSRIDAVLAQLLPEIGPVQFWILLGDGLARYGDQVIAEREFVEQHAVLSYGSALESRRRTPSVACSRWGEEVLSIRVAGNVSASTGGNDAERANLLHEQALADV